MSTEARVGAFTLAGLGLLAAVVIMLSGFRLGGSSGYTLYAGFRQVVGIVPQSQVRLSGVPVGHVADIANDGGGVTVTMDIDKDAKIPRGSRVTISSAGVMGEKFINIMPTDAGTGWVEDGDYLIGEDETGMDSLLTSMDKVMEQVQDALGSVNQILGNKDLQTSLVQVLVNMESTTEHLDRMMATLEALTVNNEGQVISILNQLNHATAGMERTMGSVEAMMANLATVGADPQTAENLRKTLNNMADASQRIVHITEGLENVAGDPKTQEDLKQTIANARALTDKADRMLGKVGELEVKPQVDVLYSGGAREWKTDFNVDVGQKQGTYFRLGVDDIGEGNHGNVQVGKHLGGGAVDLRGGLVNGKIGAGLDLHAGKRFQISVEGYDPNNAQLRLEAAYDITGQGTSVMGQWDHVNDGSRRRAYVGLRHSF